MKKNHHNSPKKTLKKQLISGGVYIALSAVAVAVTVNTAVSMLSGHNELPPISENLNTDSLRLPTVPEEIMLPELSLPKTDVDGEVQQNNVTVSDSPSGITAEITESSPSASDENTLSDVITENNGIVADEPQFNVAEISSNTNLGDNVFVKPCDGFVTVEHSLDIPVYSATLGDYRTHSGVDIAADTGAIIKAVKGGVITEIYTDDLYGSCLKLETPDGYTFVYSNLEEKLSEGIQEGMAVSTGTVLGSVGNSAILEASQESHLHLEVFKDGQVIDPQDIISF